MGMRIFLEGFASGFLAGMAIKAGFAVDGKRNISMTILEPVCIGTEAYECWRMIILIAVLSILVSVLAIIEVISFSSDIKKGFAVYQIGFLLGFVPALFFG